MSRPWMPLYVADYLRDTRRLKPAEHGAYLLLIMEYWTAGGLPADDGQLARIVGMTSVEWRKTKPTVQAFFQNGWQHQRIDDEIARATAKHERRSEAGKRGGIASANSKQKASNAGSNVQASSSQPQPEKETEANASGAEAPPDPSEPERQFFKRGREILGKSSGGQLAKLLKVAGNVALARSKIELASTKDSPAEFIAKVILAAGTGPPAKPLTQHQIERQESREILNDLQKFIDDSSGRGGDADPGLLRFDPGDGQKGVHGGVCGDLVDIPARRGREGN